MRLAFSSLAALCLAAASLPNAAFAANRYGVVCVHNQTSVPVHFQVKWADVGRWEGHVLRPGGRHWFSHEYDRQNENRSPELLVRFDSDLSQARYNLQYKLQRRAAAGKSCGEGKPYAFKYEQRNRSYIDLKSL
jgi:hypothetical protein